MIKALAHVCLGTKDLASAEQFYCGLLGLKKHFTFRRKGQPAGILLAAGDRLFIEIFAEKPEPVASGHQLIRHFCLEVDDIDQVVAHLRKNSWEVTDKKRGSEMSWQAWTKDPAGVAIEFHQYTPESHQLTGKDCELNW